MYKEKVACDIVKENFGEDVEKVFKLLVTSGKSTLKGLSQGCDLTSKRVHSCLLVLIQHNLVDYEEYLLPKEKKPGQTTPVRPSTAPPTLDDLADTIYSANLSNAIHRLRFPKYINFIREKMGDAAAILIEEFIDNGRLTMEAVVNQSTAYTKQRTANFDDDLNRQFEDVFTQLVIEHFIMKAPNPKPILMDEEESKSLAKEKKSATLSKHQQQQLHDPFALPTSLLRQTKPTDTNIITNRPVSISVDEESLGKKSKKSTTTTTSTASSSSKTKSIPKNTKLTTKKRKTIVDDDEDESLPDVLLVSESAPVDIPNENDIQPIKKRAVDVYNVVSSDEQNQMLINEEKKILWRINYDQFIIEFKLMACYEFVQNKLNNQAALIFNSMINLCKKSIKLTPENQSSSILAEHILEEYNKSVEDKIDSKQLDNYLPLMQATRPSIITKMQTHSRGSLADGGGVYQVHIGNITAVLKQKMVESIIRQKFSDSGLRVFKLLMIKKFLEPKQIAEFAMIPLKDSKTLLFKMMEQSVIKLQEVPRSSDHFAARTFYLFYVDYPSVATMFIDDIFKAIYNCRERLRSELAPHQDIVTKMETIPEDQLSDDQKVLLNKVQKLNEILETMVMNLDNDLLILNF